MRKYATTLVALVLLAWIAIVPAARAQMPDVSGPQREAMQKLAHWVGEWEGSGWAMHGPGAKSEFTVRESVQAKLGGLLLLVQGLGKTKPAEGGESTVGHDALAVVSFDSKAQKYRFRHYTMQGGSGEDDLVLTEKGMTWELGSMPPPVRVRFHIAIDGDTWHEYGEVTRDGQQWHRTMEMTLKRVKS